MSKKNISNGIFTDYEKKKRNGEERGKYFIYCIAEKNPPKLNSPSENDVYLSNF